MRPSVNEAIRLTKRNTREGRGFSDDDFGPYSPNTDKDGPVTFRDTGAAMNSLYGSQTKNRGEITFGNKNQILDYHNLGEGRNPRREIFPGADEEEVKQENTETILKFTKFVENKLEVYLNES